MKALMLAAVMALGATGASALDTNTLLTKGTVLLEAGHTDKRVVWVSYNDEIYHCWGDKIVRLITCAEAENGTVIER